MNIVIKKKKQLIYSNVQINNLRLNKTVNTTLIVILNLKLKFKQIYKLNIKQ